METTKTEEKNYFHYFIIIGISAISMYSLIGMNDPTLWTKPDLWVFIGLGILCIIGGTIGMLVPGIRKKKIRNMKLNKLNKLINKLN